MIIFSALCGVNKTLLHRIQKNLKVIGQKLKRIIPR